MDLQSRNLMRQYDAEPSDELAHRLARLFLRTNPAPTDTMEQFYEAWWWLRDHPMFRYAGVRTDESFPECLEVYPAKVDPTTRRIEDDKSKNTHVEIWIEVTTYEPAVGDLDLPGWQDTGAPCHHYRLDCGADTYEEAVIILAHKVWERRELYPFTKPWPEAIPHRETPEDELESIREELEEANNG